jgi:hypothetical protein
MGLAVTARFGLMAPALKREYIRYADETDAYEMQAKPKLTSLGNCPSRRRISS